MSKDVVTHQHAKNPRNSNKIAHFRASSMQAQQGLCYYCRQPMWVDDRGLERICRLFKMSSRQARDFRCTAEHLVAKCDGGKDVEDNIVAACRYCNRTRHQRRLALTPDRYKALVRRRLAGGKWHGFRTATTP